MVDAYSCVHGNAGQQADAQQAYTQATFKGTETWIFLPRHQWPAHWKGRYTRPVVPMLLALYGHPESGAYWEQHCEAHLTSQGFEVVPNWPSTFWHQELKLFLTVYVDDFKMAGPAQSLDTGWALIRSAIKMDDPTPFGLFLGAEHDEFQLPHPQDATRTIRGIQYNVQKKLESAVTRYCELANITKPLKKVDTPFLESADKDFFCAAVADGPWLECCWCKGRFPEDAFGQGIGSKVERKSVLPLSDPERITSEGTTRAGTLADSACAILMQVLFAARVGRFDLLRLSLIHI